MLKITRVTELPARAIDALVDESIREGFEHVRRLSEDWRSGANRFEGRGEALFAAWRGTRLVGVCGVNADPFCESGEVARLRRLYVAKSCRGHGLGRLLTLTALETARGRFRRARVRAGSEEAGRFYEALGFSLVDESEATHALTLVESS